MLERKLKLLELSDDPNGIVELLDNFLKDNPIEFYTDYNDFEGIEKMLVKCDNRDQFTEEIIDGYMDWEHELIDETISNALNHIKNAYRDFDDLSNDLFIYISDYVFENVTINYPIDDYLKQLIRVNMFITFKKSTDAETDTIDRTTLIKILDKLEYIHPKTTLTELVNQEYKGDDKFLLSLQNEILNSYPSQFNYFCVVGEITIDEYFRIKENPVGTRVIFTSDNYCGFVDPYNGGGSVLGIELKPTKPLVCKAANVTKMLVEHSGQKYTVDDIYGLTSKCYQRIEVR